jgi:hypothetical protein
MSMKPALKPARIITTIAPNTLKRNQVLGFEYEYLFAVFVFLFLRKIRHLPIHANTSCITPNGQITEQYSLPMARVSASTTARAMTFRAITLGKNCNFAIQPNHGCTVPEKSRNSNVMPTKKITASRILILRNIIV